MMKASLSILILGLLLVGSTLESCKKDKAAPEIYVPPECDSLDYEFSADILPIFLNNCAVNGCHDSQTATLGYVWETHAQISSNSQTVLKVINHEQGVVPMPYQSPQLPDSSIQRIECWVAAGMPDN